jgi:hypothetical protein
MAIELFPEMLENSQHFMRLIPSSYNENHLYPAVGGSSLVGRFLFTIT